MPAVYGFICFNVFLSSYLFSCPPVSPQTLTVQYCTRHCMCINVHILNHLYCVLFTPRSTLPESTVIIYGYYFEFLGSIPEQHLAVIFWISPHHRPVGACTGCAWLMFSFIIALLHLLEQLKCSICTLTVVTL